MPWTNLPDKRPSTAQELAGPRKIVGEQLFELSRVLMKHEFEVIQLNDADAFETKIREIAEKLNAAAATWARLSDSIRESWHA